MKLLEQKITERITQLNELGNKIIIESKISGYSTPDYSEWKSGTLNILKKVAGEQSDYYQDFLSELHNTGHPKYYVEYGSGILNSLKKDLELGFLGKIENLLLAEVFTDFLEMSEHLLEQGYYIPAASLAGGVLEDSLRKISIKHNITYPEKTKINSLNSELVKVNIYNALVAKQIIAHADIRNNADHGNFKEFNKQDVIEMVKWIRNFITTYLE